MPATLPQLLRYDCLHTLPPLGSPLTSTTTRCSPMHNRPSPQHTTSSMHSRRSEAPAHSTSPADARSVLLRSSDVSCAILKRLGASDAAPSASIRLPARAAAPRLAPRKPQLPLQPHAQPPQPTAHNIIHAHPAFASTRSQHKPSRCTQRTAEVQRRQLRHPS